MQPAPLDAPAQQATRILRLTAEVEGLSSAGYNRTLRAGSQWQPVGDIDQGQVLKPLDTVLTVEGANVREAYAVVRNGAWVGFWLPVERAFSPLRKPVAAAFEEIQQ